MEMRFVYMRNKFLGGREQVEEFAEASEQRVRIAFAYMRKYPHETAMWIQYDGYSVGYWYEGDNIAKKEITVRTQRLNAIDTCTEKVSKARNELLEAIRKEHEEQV